LIPIDILYEDNHLIAVNKKNHDLVQKDITGDKALDDKVRGYIKLKYKKPGNVFLGVIHRLDRPVSGIVLFARTSKALTRMNELFRTSSIQKTYWAIVKQKPPEESDELIHYLVKNIRQNKSYCYDKEIKHSKRAELKYSVRCRSGDYYLLEIDLKTGRHHQIRAQLAAIGCPVKGDVKYQFSEPNIDGGISLHARKISFIHPVVKKEIEIIAHPPKEVQLWENFLNVIGKEEL
jgi:23S rRNA pseudouridine1911/1915/1917 synthase